MLKVILHSLCWFSIVLQFSCAVKKTSKAQVSNVIDSDIQNPQSLQEIAIHLAVKDTYDVEYKFCERTKTCPVFRSKAKNTDSLVIKAPSLYSVRLCKRDSGSCLPWQLILLHPLASAADLQITDKSQQTAMSLALAESPVKGTSIASLGDGNFIISEYLFIDGLEASEGLQLTVTGLPNLGNTCFLNATLQMFFQSEELKGKVAAGAGRDMSDLEAILDGANPPDRRAFAVGLRQQIESFKTSQLKGLNDSIDSNKRRLTELSAFPSPTPAQMQELRDLPTKIADLEAKRGTFDTDIRQNFIERVVAKQDFVDALDGILKAMNAGGSVDRSLLEIFMSSHDRYVLAASLKGESFGVFTDGSWSLDTKQRSADEFLVRMREMLNIGVETVQYDIDKAAFDGGSKTVQIDRTSKTGLAAAVSIELDQTRTSLQDLIDGTFMHPRITEGSTHTVKRFVAPSGVGIPELTFIFPSRLTQRDGSLIKDERPVRINADTLTIDVPFANNGAKSLSQITDLHVQRMRLKSAIVHESGAGIGTGGHYVTYVFESDGTVTKCSDEIITRNFDKTSALKAVSTNGTSLHFEKFGEPHPKGAVQLLAQEFKYTPPGRTVQLPRTAKPRKALVDGGREDPKKLAGRVAPKEKIKVQNSMRGLLGPAALGILGVSAIISAPFLLNQNQPNNQN